MNLPNGISIIIPCYQSAATIGAVVDALALVLPQAAPAYEVVLVEDGSGEATWQAILALCARYAWVRGYRLMRNFGQHNALLCGIRAARYAVCLTMDDDGQHPPEAIPRLLEALTPQVDVVYGAPEQERHGFLRDLASRVTKAVLEQAMGAENARNLSALRAFRTHLREAFARYDGPYVSIDVLLTWGTRRFAFIRVAHHKRLAGASGYTLNKLVNHTFNMLTGFTTFPLRLASLLGFALTLFGILLLFYIIVVRILIFGYDVPGFTFLASIISVFAGAQMAILGIIGEYLARMHFRLMDKPPYVVGASSKPDEAESAMV